MKKAFRVVKKKAQNLLMNRFSKRSKEVPGILVHCKSGRYLAYYEHRTDIIANGNSDKEAMSNLKVMYAEVMAFENDLEAKRESKPTIPHDAEVSRFRHKLNMC